MMGLFWHLFASRDKAQSRWTHRKKLLWPSDFSQEAAPILPRYRGTLDTRPPAGKSSNKSCKDNILPSSKTTVHFLKSIFFIQDCGLKPNSVKSPPLLSNQRKTGQTMLCWIFHMLESSKTKQPQISRRDLTQHLVGGGVAVLWGTSVPHCDIPKGRFSELPSL